MSREIKFRGKRIDNGEWVYGSLIGSDVIVGKIVDWDSEYFCTEFWLKVDPETVGQCTNLNDCNGKVIYEGDILKIPDLYELPENTSMTYHNEIVDFKNFTFNLGDVPLGDDYEYISDECEVIGNKSDHPNLLKE